MKFLIAAATENEDIVTNYIKAKINKTQEKSNIFLARKEIKLYGTS